jgi:DNA helicase HerA-like ATPase
MKLITTKREGAGVRQIYKAILSTGGRYADRKIYEELFGEQIEETSTSFKIGINEVILGFTSLKFEKNNLVKLNMNLVSGWETGKPSFMPKTVCVIGKKGSGKTVLMKMLIEQIRKRFGFKVVKIDPYGEFYTSKHPFAYNKSSQYQQYLDQWMGEFGQTRYGLKLVVISPRYLRKETSENPDVNVIYYAIHYHHFKDMAQYNNERAMTLLAELLGLSENRANINLLMTVMADNKINSWHDLYNALAAGVRRKESTQVSVIFYAIRAMMAQHILSDDEKDDIDIMQLIAENDELIFKGRLRKSSNDTFMDRIYNVHVKMLLDLPSNDLKRFAEGATDTYLQGTPIIIASDETDSLAPAEGICSLTEDYIQLAKKERKTQIFVFNAVQSAEDINKSLLDQSDFIFTFRVDEENVGVFKKRHVSKGLLDRLANLVMAQATKPSSIGTTPSECAVLNERNECVAEDINGREIPGIFYGFPPSQAFYQRTFSSILPRASNNET